MGFAELGGSGSTIALWKHHSKNAERSAITPMFSAKTGPSDVRCAEDAIQFRDTLPLFKPNGNPGLSSSHQVGDAEAANSLIKSSGKSGFPSHIPSTADKLPQSLPQDRSAQRLDRRISHSVVLSRQLP